MKSYLVRSIAVLSLTGLAACGEKAAGSAKLDALAEGISRDSTLVLLGTGVLSASGADTVRVVNGHRSMRYFVNGKNFEVLYARDEPGNVSEPVQQQVETPIVLLDAKVLGWGWKYYVEAMKEYGLPTPLKEVLNQASTGPDTAAKK